MTLEVSKIIPGDWGKVKSGWLAEPLISPDRKVGMAEAEFTSSSGGVRAPSVTRSRNLAIRSDEKPFRIESSNSCWFQA